MHKTVPNHYVVQVYIEGGAITIFNTTTEKWTMHKQQPDSVLAAFDSYGNRLVLVLEKGLMETFSVPENNLLESKGCYIYIIYYIVS